VPHLYLNLDENGKAVGCQTAPSFDKKTQKAIPARSGNDIVPVDEKTYNDFTRLGQYESMTYTLSGQIIDNDFIRLSWTEL